MKHSICLMGSGMVPESSYRKIRIMGNGEFYGGSADCVHVMGNSEFQDSMRIGQLKNIGNLEAENVDISCEKAILRGRAVFRKFTCGTLVIKKSSNTKSEDNEITGIVEAKNVRIQGSTSFESLRVSQELLLLEKLVVEQPLIAERVVGKGGCLTASELECESVEGVFGPDTDIGEVHATTLSMRCSQEGESCHIGLLEADEVDCQGLRAETVCGFRVRLGPDCHIERVEYRFRLEADPKAVIGEKVFMGKESRNENRNDVD